jgi:hypothetical protein
MMIRTLVTSAYWFVLIGLCVIAQADQAKKEAKWLPRQAIQGQYVGAQACAECHTDIYRKQIETGMSQALQTGLSNRILAIKSSLEFQSGPHTYQISQNGKESTFSVTDGRETISETIIWSFGQGLSGQTFVFLHGGQYYESRVSFYTRIQGLDYTLGYSRKPAKSLTEALGNELHHSDAVNCIGCHTTAAVNGRQLYLERLVPGIQCEACHGPGDKHVAAMKAGRPNGVQIFNPGKLSPEVLSQDFCGACHRSAQHVFEMPLRGDVSNIRFQPYRLFNSKCFSDDRRISCIGCHDPHDKLNSDPTFYDSRCQACHRTATAIANETHAPAGGRRAAICPVGKQQCTTCHMPKAALPGSHFEFTDHRIRIDRPGIPFPI